jgi:hypothetical protein
MHLTTYCNPRGWAPCTAMHRILHMAHRQHTAHSRLHGPSRVITAARSAARLPLVPRIHSGCNILTFTNHHTARDTCHDDSTPSLCAALLVLQKTLTHLPTRRQGPVRPADFTSQLLAPPPMPPLVLLLGGVPVPAIPCCSCCCRACCCFWMS